MKGYKAVDTKAEWLQSRHPRVEFWTSFRYQDFPQEDFFGLGFSSNVAARTDYSLVSRDVSALTIFHAARWLSLGAAGGLFSPTIGPGTDENFPSTQFVFTEVEAPGLTSQPNFLHATVFADIDTRDQRDNARSGGHYMAAFSRWDDRTLHRFDFARFDGQAAQYIPLGTKKHIIAARVGVSTVNNEADDRVPFYFRPYVGGSDTIRSFKEFRFTDENSLYINAEYRWTAVKYLDVAFFWDGGKVTHAWHDVNLRGIKTAYGVGFRAATPKRVFARLDIGTGGGEGHQIFFKLGPSF
jgi:outer membrane protein assembly factor BamA